MLADSPNPRIDILGLPAEVAELDQLPVESAQQVAPATLPTIDRLTACELPGAVASRRPAVLMSLQLAESTLAQISSERLDRIPIALGQLSVEQEAVVWSRSRGTARVLHMPIVSMHSFGFAIDVDSRKLPGEDAALVGRALQRAGWESARGVDTHFECSAAPDYTEARAKAELSRHRVTHWCSLWEEAARLVRGRRTVPAPEPSDVTGRLALSAAFDAFNSRLRQNKADEQTWWERLGKYNESIREFNAFVAQVNSMSPEARAAYKTEYDSRRAPLLVSGSALDSDATGLNERRQKLIDEFAALAAVRAQLVASDIARAQAIAERTSAESRLAGIDQELAALLTELGRFEPGAAADDTADPWTASQPQLAFRELVLAAHTKRSASSGPTFRDLQAQELGSVLGSGVRLRTDAAVAASRLILDAEKACKQARKSGNADALLTVEVGATSGFRSSAEQRRVWEQAFPVFYNDTRSQRANQDGGKHGDAAAAFLAEYIGQRVAAPGFSHHNAGVAVDLSQVRLVGSPPVKNDTSAESVKRWRETWLYSWLREHAGSYGFVPYEREPWHWEFRGTTAAKKP